MSKVVVYTQAHNSEKTLCRSLDSVLKQSFRDFTYYVGDNCSTDQTRKIIREYAQKDKRIRPIYYDVDDQTGSGFWRILCSIEHIRMAAEFEWLCILDSDDVYEPEFLQEMLRFGTQKHLDMAVCGSRFIRADSGQQLGARAVPADLVIEKDDFGTYFPVYHQFMRTLWAKLIRRSAVEGADLNALGDNRSVGADTRLAFEFLRHCQSFGISSKLLHRYSLSSSSASYRLDANRIEADALQHRATMDFLMEKAGAVSPENLNFLYVVYYNAVIDTTNVLLKASNASLEEKLAGLRSLLSTDITLEMLNSDAVEIDKRRQLLQQILTVVGGLGDTMVHYEDAVWLGLNIAALLGDQEEYVRLSKLQIRFLLNAKREAEAEEQLKEWEAILPNDLDWKEIRREFQEIPIIRGGNLPNRFIFVGLTEFVNVAAVRLGQIPEAPKVVGVCDLSGQYVGKQLQTPFGEIPIINIQELIRSYRQKPDQIGILLTENPFRWNQILGALRQKKINRVFVVPNYAYREENSNFIQSITQVPMERPMLTYYEYHVAEHCNLNCYQCGNFSNLICQPVFGDIGQYKRDVKRLSELFWNVGHMRFQGGEPLLSPDLPEYLRITREAFPMVDIGILSNGLLIPQIDPAVFQAMRECHAFFWLSGYPPTHKMMDKIQARCNAEHVPVSIQPLITEWREESVKAMEMPPSKDWSAAEKRWRTCGARDSHFLSDGYLYYCCFTNTTLPVLYDRLERDITKNHMWQHRDQLRFDLYDPALDGWRISEKLDHVHETCLYCVNRWPNFRMVPWRTSPSNQFNPEDYLWDPLMLSLDSEQNGGL